MHNKKNNTWSIILPVLVIGFFALPILFPGAVSKTIDTGDVNLVENGSSLPIIASDNPLSKYLSKLGEFYGIKKSFNKNPALQADYGAIFEEVQQAAAEQEDADITFAYDRDGNAVGLLPGPGGMPAFLTVEGGSIVPSGNGYYYNNEFYPNGSYPQGVSAKKVENALLRYYKAISKRNGKLAAYVRQPDGSLAVNYFTPQEMNYMKNTAASELYADAGRYNGARIASRGGSSVGGDGSVGGNSSAGPMGDLADRYAAVGAKIAAMAPAGTIGNNNTGEDGTGDTAPAPIDLNKMDKVANGLFRETELGDRAEKQDYSRLEFMNSPVFVRTLKTETAGELSPVEIVLMQLGFTEGQADVEGSSGQPFERALDANIQAKIRGTNFRYFSVLKGEARAKEKAKLEAMVPAGQKMYYEALRTPYFDYANKDKESIKDVFFVRTGLENVTEAAGVCTDKLHSLVAAYERLDKDLAKERKNIAAKLAKDPNIKNLKQEVVFVVGATENGKIKVATAESHLYAYFPGLIPQIALDKANDHKTYAELSPAEFRHYFVKDGVAGVTTTDNNKKILESNNIKTVIVVKDTKLASLAPNDISDNMRIIGAGLAQESRRVSQSSLIEDEIKRAELSSIGKKPQDKEGHAHITKPKAAKKAATAVAKPAPTRPVAKPVPQINGFDGFTQPSFWSKDINPQVGNAVNNRVPLKPNLNGKKI